MEKLIAPIMVFALLGMAGCGSTWTMVPEEAEWARVTPGLTVDNLNCRLDPTTGEWVGCDPEVDVIRRADCFYENRDVDFKWEIPAVLCETGLDKELR